MRSFVSRIVGLTASALTGTLSLAVVDTAPAGAHCGDHAGTCGTTTYLVYEGCHPQGATWLKVYEVYANNCSGTCVGGTEGCCDSPDACWDAPCKSGGCGGACGYLYSYEEERPSKPPNLCGV